MTVISSSPLNERLPKANKPVKLFAAAARSCVKLDPLAQRHRRCKVRTKEPCCSQVLLWFGLIHSPATVRGRYHSFSYDSSQSWAALVIPFPIHFLLQSWAGTSICVCGGAGVCEVAKGLPMAAEQDTLRRSSGTWRGWAAGAAGPARPWLLLEACPAPGPCLAHVFSLTKLVRIGDGCLLLADK